MAKSLWLMAKLFGIAKMVQFQESFDVIVVGAGHAGYRAVRAKSLNLKA